MLLGLELRSRRGRRGRLPDEEPTVSQSAPAPPSCCTSLSAITRRRVRNPLVVVWRLASKDIAKNLLIFYQWGVASDTRLRAVTARRSEDEWLKRWWSEVLRFFISPLTRSDDKGVKWSTECQWRVQSRGPCPPRLQSREGRVVGRSRCPGSGKLPSGTGCRGCTRACGGSTRSTCLSSRRTTRRAAGRWRRRPPRWGGSLSPGRLPWRFVCSQLIGDCLGAISEG